MWRGVAGAPPPPPAASGRGPDAPGKNPPAGAGAELEHPPSVPLGEDHDPLDGRVDVRHVAVPVVVDVGEAVAVGAGPVSLHGLLPVGSLSPAVSALRSASTAGLTVGGALHHGR